MMQGAPKHDSPHFIDWLKENNTVVYEDTKWIVVRNWKYYTEENPFYTAFRKDLYMGFNDLEILYEMFKDYEWLRKSPPKQSITKRFHIHIIKNIEYKN